MDPNVASIISFTIQIFGCNVSALSVDRFGRKKVFTLSAAGSAISVFVFGVYSYLDKAGVTLSHLHYIPVASLSFFVFCNCAGLLTLPYILLAEILSTEVSILMSVAVDLIYSKQYFLDSQFWINNLYDIDQCVCICEYKMVSCYGLSFPSVYSVLDIWISLCDWCFV